MFFNNVFGFVDIDNRWKNDFSFLIDFVIVWCCGFIGLRFYDFYVYCLVYFDMKFFCFVIKEMMNNDSDVGVFWWVFYL